MCAFLSGSDLGGVPGSAPASGGTQAWAALKFTTFSVYQADRWTGTVPTVRTNLISNNVIIFWQTSTVAGSGISNLIFDPDMTEIFFIREPLGTGTGTYVTHKLRIKIYGWEFVIKFYITFSQIFCSILPTQVLSRALFKRNVELKKKIWNCRS